MAAPPPPDGPVPSTTITVEQVRAVDGELVEAFARLLPQLSPGMPASRDALARTVAADANVVLVARRAGVVVGALTLVLVDLPTGRRARIEDVVVDRAARGHGVGTQLCRAALARAAAAGAGTVDLTARPTRTDAHRLYERLGFVRRDTRVYRYPG